MVSRILKETGGGGQGSTFNLGESKEDPDTFCFYILSSSSKIARFKKPTNMRSCLSRLSKN